MSQFITVNTQAEMDEFLFLVDGFHDSLLREVGIVSRGYVHQNGNMHGDVAPSDARMVIHSQFSETPYIEMVFEELQALMYNPRSPLDPASGVVTNEGVMLGFGAHPESFKVLAKKMSYRILGREFLGKEPRTIEMIVESDY